MSRSWFRTPAFAGASLVISVRATCYQRERWITPDGRTILAPLPEGIAGHFGPELRRFVPMHYRQGQSTLPRLLAFLRSVGIAISKRQLRRLLTDKQDDFVTEARAVLRAGLETSPFVSVDDTGARHGLPLRRRGPGRTAFARKSAMTGSPGLAQRHRRAG
jgi:hypothetical protein